MYLDKSKVTIKGKTYSRCLLRESFRENGKVKHRTIANLSQCSPEEIAAITLAFEHKHDLAALKRPVPLESLYRLVQELALRWSDLDLTVGEGIEQLGTLCLTEVQSAGKALCSTMPIPRPEVAELISRSGIALPEVIKRHGAKVATKKKLQNNRVTRS